MYVYFIKALVGCDPNVPHRKAEHARTRIKIGWSKDPKKRLRDLQTGSAIPLQLMGIIECQNEKNAKEIEKHLHKMFNNKRKNGEWFRLSMKDLSKITTLIHEVETSCDNDRRTDFKHINIKYNKSIK